MAWITDGKEIKKRIALSKDADMNRLAEIIEKKGGSIWEKKGRRAYCPKALEDCYTVDSKLPAPFCDVYVDLEAKEIVLTISDQDEKFFDEAIYKKVIIDFLRK